MKQQKNIFVKEKDNGVRLDNFLVSSGFFATRGEAQEHIEQGNTLINENVVVRSSTKLKPGMEISFVDKQGKPRVAPRKEIEIKPSLPTPRVLAEEASFMVLYKPAGIAMHPASARQTKNTVTEWISTNYPQIVGIGEDKNRPGMVHRLDKDTSGLVLIAKSQRAFKALKRLFQERKIEKTYFALVYGNFKQASGVIDAPIGRVRGSEKRAIPAGKRTFGGEVREAVTEYALHTRYPQYDFLSVKPKTGRTHQIRVHLSSVKHPIVGDKLYRFKEHQRDPLKPPFHLLHAGELRFTLNKQKYSFSAPLPDYFADTLKMLDAEAGRRYDWSA